MKKVSSPSRYAGPSLSYEERRNASYTQVLSPSPMAEEGRGFPAKGLLQ
jgi:hypothetical protein